MAHSSASIVCFFFFNDTATTEIYTLSLHDALPISRHEVDRGSAGPEDVGGDGGELRRVRPAARQGAGRGRRRDRLHREPPRSEEHTSELQSQSNLVCRLLLEKKKKNISHIPTLIRR